MRIALQQARGTPGDVEANVVAVERAAAAAAEQGARLLITPEAFLSGYDVPGLKELALPEPPRIAADGIAVLVGWTERHGERVFNSATLFDADGSPVLTHRKLHLYGSVDRDAFEAGDDLATAEIDGVTIGVLICFDIEYPEAARALALKGAQLIAVPTSLMKPYDHVATTMVPTRAAENQVFVAYANRVGKETTLEYVGLSTVAGPDGEILARAPADDETLLIADIDPSAIDASRAQHDYLAERRPGLYGL